jgi:Protein of unknown function (DUF3592)
MTNLNAVEPLVFKLGIFAFMAVAYPAWHHFNNRRRHNAAQDWPRVTATVQSCLVESVPKSSHHAVSLCYSYFVDEYRSGEYKRIFSNEDRAYEFARSFKDRKIEARYSPRNADVSVLDETTIDQLAAQLRLEETAGLH